MHSVVRHWQTKDRFKNLAHAKSFLNEKAPTGTSFISGDAYVLWTDSHFSLRMYRFASPNSGALFWGYRAFSVAAPHLWNDLLHEYQGSTFGYCFQILNEDTPILTVVTHILGHEHSWGMAQYKSNDWLLLALLTGGAMSSSMCWTKMLHSRGEMFFLYFSADLKIHFIKNIVKWIMLLTS